MPAGRWPPDAGRSSSPGRAVEAGTVHAAVGVDGLAPGTPASVCRSHRAASATVELPARRSSAPRNRSQSPRACRTPRFMAAYTPPSARRSAWRTRALGREPLPGPIARGAVDHDHFRRIRLLHEDAVRARRICGPGFRHTTMTVSSRNALTWGRCFDPSVPGPASQGRARAAIPGPAEAGPRQTSSAR